MTTLINGLAHDPQFPERVITATTEHDGLQYLYLGEDSEKVVILGHPDAAAAFTLIRHAVPDMLDIEDDPTVDELTYTWARSLTACPNHTQEQEDCRYCNAGELTGAGWLDWPHSEVKRDEPGYFPVTVFDVYA